MFCSYGDNISIRTIVTVLTDIFNTLLVFIWGGCYRIIIFIRKYG